MTSSSVISLFRFPVVVHIHKTNGGIRNENMPFNDSDFRAYKGAQTDIDFIVRNNDRKPVTLAGKNAYVIIRDNETKQQVLKKSLKFIDESRGKLQLSLTPAEIAGWEEGYYEYVILQENRDGSQNILYTSQDQDARGWFELRSGALPPLSQSYELTPAQFHPIHVGGYPGGTTRWISDHLPGDAKLGFKEGLHTFAVYLSKFTGRLWVQGSLETCTPSSETDWFFINLTPNTFELHFTNACGIEPYNFEANISWVRFVYEGDVSNAGLITRILYKP